MDSFFNMEKSKATMKMIEDDLLMFGMLIN